MMLTFNYIALFQKQVYSDNKCFTDMRADKKQWENEHSWKHIKYMTREEYVN